MKKITSVICLLFLSYYGYSQVYFNSLPEDKQLVGRDISTNILPNSDLKFYFKCNLNVAASRRYLELKEKNQNIKLLDVKRALRLRNIQDTKRKRS